MLLAAVILTVFGIIVVLYFTGELDFSRLPEDYEDPEDLGPFPIIYTDDDQED